MYVLKHVPEDFVVIEESTMVPKGQGKYAYVKLWKKEWTTIAAVSHLEKVWKVRHIGVAGLKDKQAVTEQIISVQHVAKERLEYETQGLRTTLVGFGDEPVHKGALKGNHFKITIRNIESLPVIKERFRNFYGEQRFSKKNVDVGRLLLQHKFEDALQVIENLHPQLKEKFAKQNNWAAKLHCVPRRILLLYIHAYQSYIWNEAAKESTKEMVPLVGFDAVPDEASKKVLERDGLTQASFIFREFPELSVEGGERKVWVEAQNLRVGKLEDDEVSKKKKVTLEFFLSKGSYATEFIRQNFQ